MRLRVLLRPYEYLFPFNHKIDCIFLTQYTLRTKQNFEGINVQLCTKVEVLGLQLKEQETSCNEDRQSD